MNTLPSKVAAASLAALTVLLSVTGVRAQTTYTAQASANWNTPSTWSPAGAAGSHPGSGDSVIIPAGKNVNYNSGSPVSVCTDSGQSIDVSGTLTVGNAGTFGDVVVEPGGTFSGSNGKIPTFAGNYTNNGLTVIGGAADSWVYSGVNKALSGNITNPGVTISGIYTNYGVFQCNNTPTISVGGSLINLGKFVYKAAPAPTTVLSRGDFTTVGNTFAWYGAGIATGATVPANVYNLVVGTTAGGGAKFALGSTTIAGSLTLTNNTPETAADWPVNGLIPGGVTFGNTGNSTFPATFSIGSYNQITAMTAMLSANATLTVTGTGAATWTRSGGTFTAGAGSTVDFTGPAPNLTGPLSTTFKNLTIASTATAANADAGSFTVTATLAVNGGFTVAAPASGTLGACAVTIGSGGTFAIQPSVPDGTLQNATNLSVSAGTLKFDFANAAPSLTVAPLQINADAAALAASSATLTVANAGSVAIGTYPLIRFTGGTPDLSGFTTQNLPAGTLLQVDSGVINLVVGTSQTVPPASITATSTNATPTFYGAPGTDYTIQRATNVTFTAGVSNFPPIMAPGNGAFSVTDDFSDLGVPPGAAFYRLLAP